MTHLRPEIDDTELPALIADYLRTRRGLHTPKAIAAGIAADSFDGAIFINYRKVKTVLEHWRAKGYAERRHAANRAGSIDKGYRLSRERQR